MAMSDDRERLRLPCGTELQRLIVQVADDEPARDPAHQAICPYCQATLRSLRTAWTDIRTIATEPVPIPRDLTARIMARIRNLTRHTTDSLLHGSPRGETRIAHTVVTRIIQRLALAVPGVVFASVRAYPHDPPDPARLDVAIRLAVTFGPAIEATAGTLRTLIDRHITRLTGGYIDRIDITIDDITDPAAD
jgi:uncharacterized alkaline shock family protein YloU